MKYEEPSAIQTEANRRFPLSASHRDAFIKGAQWVSMQWTASFTDSKCTCKNSSFGMDVDRCPVHGEGCA